MGVCVAAIPIIKAVWIAANLQNKNLSFKLALLIPSVSTNAFFIRQIYFYLSRYHVPTNSVARFFAYKHTQNPQFLLSLWRRANARKVGLLTLYRGQFTLSTQSIKPNYPVILSHRHSTTVSLETYPLYSSFRLCVVLFTKQRQNDKEKLALRLFATDKKHLSERRLKFLYIYEDVQRDLVEEFKDGVKADSCTENKTASKVKMNNCKLNK